MTVSLVRRRGVNMRGPCPVLHVLITLVYSGAVSECDVTKIWAKWSGGCDQLGHSPHCAGSGTVSDCWQPLHSVLSSVCSSPIYPLVASNYLSVAGLMLFALPDEGGVWILQYNSEGWSVVCRKKIRRNVLEEIRMDEITIVVVIRITNQK